ncbi:restriction endonuclease [Streptomyces niveus]|uniref:restriction endonuclease n=1 Tax=Streptomyces niveus TaxID=193462 RepID=UPI0033F920A1
MLDLNGTRHSRFDIDECVRVLERLLQDPQDSFGYARYGDQRPRPLLERLIRPREHAESLRESVYLVETIIDAVDFIERAAKLAEDESLFPPSPSLKSWLEILSVWIADWRVRLLKARRKVGRVEERYWIAALTNARKGVYSSRIDREAEDYAINFQAAAAAVAVAREVASEICRELHFLKKPMDAFEARHGIGMEQIDDGNFSDFEHLIATLLKRDGCIVTRIQGGAGDMGGDVLAKTVYDMPMMVQCKYSADQRFRVGQPVVQHAVGGARTVFQAGVVIVVTNREFTRPARDYAKLETVRATLVDREMLAKWAGGKKLLEVIDS